MARTPALTSLDLSLAAPLNTADPVFKTKESQVAELLRERIMSGRFPRGYKLRQAEIASMFNLSITPVREALKLLESEGYVVGASHRGSIVAPLELNQVEEFFELRLDLEGRLARAAAKHITPADIDALTRINAGMHDVLAREDMHGHRQLNFRFHFRLYETANLPQTLHFVRVVWAKYPFELLSVMPNRPTAVIDEHDVILNALRAGEHKAVVKAVLAHIENGHRRFKRHYAEEIKRAAQSRL